MANTIAQYRAVTAQQERFMGQFDRLPAPKRDLEHFRAAAPKLDSVEALLKDRRSLTVVLSAFQLEDKVDARGMLRKVLTEPVNEPTSLVNRLIDTRYKQLATALAGLADGRRPFASANVVNQITASYRTNEFEKYQGEQTTGLREALFFRRNAGTVTSVFQILSSKPMTEVIRVGLGLPKEVAMLDVKKQAALIEKRIDVSRLKEPAYMEKLVDRYLAKVQAESAGPASTNPLLGLFGGGRGGILV